MSSFRNRELVFKNVSKKLVSLVERVVESPMYVLSNARSIIQNDIILLDILRFENSHTLQSKLLTLSSHQILAQNAYFSRVGDPK